MAVRYKQWLAATGRKGTQDDAYRWKTTHGVALGLYNPDGSVKKAAPSTSELTTQTPATNAAAEENLRRQRDALADIYNPQRGVARDRTRAALSGYGDMFTWQADNPATPEDESLQPKVNAQGGGQLQRDAYRSVNQAHANHGTLSSSFAQRDQERARQDLADRARNIMYQYADQLASIRRSQDTEYNRLTDSLTALYGKDAAYFAQTLGVQ